MPVPASPALEGTVVRVSGPSGTSYITLLSTQLARTAGKGWINETDLATATLTFVAGAAIPGSDVSSVANTGGLPVVLVGASVKVGDRVGVIMPYPGEPSGPPPPDALTVAPIQAKVIFNA